MDQIDRLVQTYYDNFSEAGRPQALVMNVMRHGAIVSLTATYLTVNARHKQRLQRCRVVSEKARKATKRALQEAILKKSIGLTSKKKKSS